MEPEERFETPEDAANDPRILVFGRLLGAANRLEFILGAAIEAEAGIDHSLYELLLIVARAGDGGIAVRGIAQSRVLTSGGATRLVQRAVAKGLVSRRTCPTDKRVQLIELTPHGSEIVTTVSVIHARGIERYLLDVLTADQRVVFAEAVRAISKNAAAALPVMP
ncbi:MarR family winged helix-turn-helix transcriptional regulator [Microbacterium sp. ZW CA_36]|uniref:MarR family winged helix-turn-helix transcriptional regulator n=1 Tax=Microbacterium sp. ZW CA_36 TaxID=3378078 RepID=UPI003853FE0B